MIKDVRIKQLRVIPDERGRLMETLRCDDEVFIKFGQAYITTAYPGVVKGWHYHKVQVDNFVALKGMFKVVLYDGREESPTRGEINEFFMGIYNPILLQIPRLVIHGFKAIGEEESIMLNIPTEPYKYDAPDEHRIDPHSTDVPYDWTLKDR
ncbi:MAG: dTDP-4-dehydrorhamnose 3,5-epimerase family protein [Acidobacteriota bacterium]